MTIVFTCGCFDNLHPGHRHLLREARKLGDYLIVAVNSDDYIRRAKRREPIDSADERQRAVFDTGLVDLVVGFDEDTPLSLILHYTPTVIVTGDDYTEERVVGWQEAKAWGGVVVRVPRLPGYSTSLSLCTSTA